MSWISASILLFLVMDPFGNVPVFLWALQNVPPERRQRTIVRELFIALAVLVVFLFSGPGLLEALHISEPSLRIAGGIILFLVAVKMIFGAPEGLFPGSSQDEDPMIVPLAIPCIAGPSAIATVMLLMGQAPARWPAWLGALLLAWALSGAILLLSTQLNELLGRRGLDALQHLMGLILTALAVEMFLRGIGAFFGT